jgi:predicted amidohydrolase
MAIGICRDLCDPAITDALAQLGVNLLVVPACSPKTTNLARGAEAVAVDAGGFALVANGPPTFEQPNRPPAKVATAIWCTPLDRTEPRLMASTDTAGVVVVDLDGHRLIPNPWP